MVTRSFSVESGFSRKSTAPSRVARTAVSTLAWPEIITTGVVTPAAFKSSSSEIPSLPGMTTSEKITSKRLRADQFERARGAVAHRGFVSGKAKRARKRGERVRIVVDEQQMWLWEMSWCFTGSGGGENRRVGRPFLGRFVFRTKACCSIGNSMRNVAPAPGADSTSIFPP